MKCLAIKIIGSALEMISPPLGTVNIVVAIGCLPWMASTAVSQHTVREERRGRTL